MSIAQITHYEATCDECGHVSAYHDTAWKRLVGDLRAEGWVIGRLRLLCPQCASAERQSQARPGLFGGG